MAEKFSFDLRRIKKNTWFASVTRDTKSRSYRYSTPTPPTHGWTIKRIRDITEAKFGKQPQCWCQVKTALAIYEGKDVVGCAPTGAGKTAFHCPIFMTATKEFKYDIANSYLVLVKHIQDG